MSFAIKAEVGDARAASFAFRAQKTMYGGRRIAEGDTIFVFASENQGGPGLVASGVVTSARAIARNRRRLGRGELKPFSDWSDGRPETELNFKFYRQATNKIVGISDQAAALLRGYF